jgi:hypothetical protein
MFRDNATAIGSIPDWPKAHAGRTRWTPALRHSGSLRAKEKQRANTVAQALKLP